LALDSAAAEVNPTKSVENCGNIMDAVVARLRGTNPKATAPAETDGNWDNIEARLNTKIEWGQTLENIYQHVANSGNGAIGVIGILNSDSKNSYVVIIANDHGTVGIVEGQDWGNGNGAGPILAPKKADLRYSPNGGSTFGFGMLP
jgi:hypothetical protein